MTDSVLLSVVVPVYNEREVLPELHRRLSEVLLPFDDEGVEIIMVNDGSVRADTLPALRELQARDARIRIIDLARNFGHQMALTAGLDHARGRAVICLDSDLQHPPELIPDLIRHWREGYEVVYTRKRVLKGASWLKTRLSRGFYRMINAVSSVKIDYGAADFRLIDRRVLEVLRSCRERHRFLRGMVSWVGFRHLGIDYDMAARFADKPKYTLRGLFGLAMDGIFSFSFAPLRASAYLGALLCLLAVGYAGFLFGWWLLAALGRLDGEFPSGWTTLALGQLFLGGVQLIMLGLVGEYVGRIYDEVKHRPLYIVRDPHEGSASGDAPPAP